MSSQYRKIKHGIFASHNPLKGFTNFIEDSDTSTIHKFRTALCNESSLGRMLVGILYPDQISLLGKCGIMPWFRDIEKTLLWYSMVLAANAKVINNFLTLRSKFDFAFLWGNYDECLQILDSCHQRWGWSMWEVRNRLSVYNKEVNGIAKETVYINQVLTQTVDGSIQHYVIDRFSKQCKQDIPTYTYFKLIRSDYDHFISQDVPPLLSKYAYYKAGGYTLDSENGIAILEKDVINYFLYRDDKEPLIDRYLSFCRIVDDIFTVKSNACADFSPYLDILAHKIQDPFLQNLTHHIHKHYCRFRPKGIEQIYQAMNVYSKGQYQKSFDLAEKLLHQDVDFFALVELYAKSNIYLSNSIKQGSTLEKIASGLYQLFARSGNIKEVQEELIQILYTHLDTVWPRELLLILKRHNFGLTTLEDINASGFWGNVSTPYDVFMSSVDHIGDYLQTCTAAWQDSLAMRFSIAVRTKDIAQIENLHLDPIRKGKYIAKLLLEQKPADALSRLEQLRSQLEAAPVYMELDAMRIQANLELGNLLEAMCIFVPDFTQNKNFIYIGGIDRIFSVIKSMEYNTRDSILTPIICGIYFNYYPGRNDRDDIIWSICYKDYLDSCHVDRPSELLDLQLDGVSKDDLIRFLSENCVIKVMERSIAFPTYEDVLRERKTICEALIKLDPDRENKYVAEINRLTKNLLISIAKHEVEKGKISIDVEGIQTLLYKEVRESYEQYMNLRKSKRDEQAKQVMKEITAKEGVPHVEGDLLKEAKRSDMFKSIIHQTRNIFTADNKYGLDGCLSVRIRHGALESQLRSCFEKHKLVTTRSADGNYRRNEYWLGKAPSDNKGDADINEIFSQFSSQVDHMINFLKTELIQIRTEEKNFDGLFDFVVNDNTVARIEDKILDETTFEEFEAILLDILLEWTEENLEKVRETLRGDINDRFQRELKTLETKLMKVKVKRLSDLGINDQIANARTAISTELNAIAGWFKMTHPNDFDDFSPSLALSISSDAMQKSHVAFKLDVRSEVDNKILLKGNALIHFVDIFNILLDNAIKHSGFTDNVTVEISTQKEDDWLFITARNPINPRRFNFQKVDEFKTHNGSWESTNSVRQEGGSGLHKLKKILSIDLKSLNENNIDIFYKDNFFWVEIKANLSEVLL